MNDTRELLDRLRLDRDLPSRVATGPAHSTMRGLCAGIALTAIAAGVLSFLDSTDGVSVETADAAPERTSVAELAAPLRSEAAPAMDGIVLNASGYVVARRQATVSAKLTARVTEVLIDEGQHVAAGAVIARLDDTNLRANLARSRAQLAQAQAAWRAAELALANEQPLFTRTAQQLQRGTVSQQDYDTAKARIDAARAAFEIAAQTVAVAEAELAIAERNLDDTVVRAPFAGVVTVKAAQPGEMVSPVSAGGGFTRTGIGTIVDMGSLEVEVDVSESFINRIAAEQRVEIRLNAYPDWPLEGHVITVVPTAERAKATVKVRIALGTRDPRILPEMGARVSFMADGAAITNHQAAPATGP